MTHNILSISHLNNKQRSGIPYLVLISFYEEFEGGLREMCVLNEKLKSHDQGEHNLERKVKAVAGRRGIGTELAYGHLSESYTVTTVE